MDGLVGDLPGLNGTDLQYNNVHTEDMSGNVLLVLPAALLVESNLTCSPFYTLVVGNPVHQVASQIRFEDASLIPTPIMIGFCRGMQSLIIQF